MRKIIFIFIVLITYFSVNAQDAKQILKKLQDKVKSADGFSSDFVQSFITTEGKTVQNLKGKFVYANDDKFIVELKNQQIISDGKTVWNYNKTQKQVIINNTSDDPSAFSIQRYLFVYPEYCNLTINEDVKFKNSIKLVPKNNDLEFLEVVIYADENFQVKKILITDTQNNKYLLELNKITIIEKVDYNIFKFDVPKGIKAIDLR